MTPAQTLSAPAQILRRLHRLFLAAQRAGAYPAGARYALMIERFRGVHPEAHAELERFVEAHAPRLAIVTGGRA